MKISFPLSLKFSLWLLLNLLLLAGLAIAFLTVQGGIGWDSLMRGPAGNRLQELGATIVGQFSSASNDAERREVLDRFGRAYGATFFVFHPALPGAASPRDTVPNAVALRAEEGPRAGGGPGGPGLGEPPLGPPPEREGLPGEDGAPRGPPSRQLQSRGRFLVLAGDPVAYWLGARVPIPRPIPVTFVARVDSWWSLMRLLDLQIWLITGSGIVAFSILFWLPFVLGVTRALRQLTAATGEIAEGNFDARVPENRSDELGTLGGSVNRMAARLDTYVKGQKKFLGDIAHELGSPLGRLQMAVEILESRADPSLQEQITDVREEVQQMSALVNELLAFTKAGLRPRTAELAAVELAPLARDVVARENATGRVALAVNDDLSARADAPLLSRALCNLVRNALRYAGDGLICLTARRDGEQVLVLVEDDGPGVPPEALERLGEPFFRPEVARTRETGGVGLGLSIVRSSVAACGGEVRFSNRAPRGFRAEVRLAAAA